MLRSTTRAIVAAGIGALGILAATASAQDLERSRFIASSDVLSQISMFTYQERRKSRLIFRATPIISTGEGKVEVEYQDDNARISAEVKKMPPPAALGPYTTYVLWTLTPDGRAANEGVLTGPEGGSGSLETQHSASQFTLIVTAEPHFAVSAPSTMVVMYNVADRIRGVETKISSLFERADYSALTPIDADGLPNELVQAQYAVTIAESAGAEEYVPNYLYAAQAKLIAAVTAWNSNRSRDRRSAAGIAREAVTAGEDARRAALVGRAEADAQAQREAAVAAERERAATAAVAAERERVAAAAQAAERERAAVAAAAAAAERERAAAAAMAAERERAAAAAAAAARQLAANSAAEAALLAQAAAEAASRAAVAETEARMRAQARAELLNRLSSVLPTRETDRGLVSEVGGVQFATGTANLNMPARESLARFSGIVASYPELNLKIEGHTDNVGTDTTNNELSLRRAISVRDYLIRLGVPDRSINVDGYGSARPIADNTSIDGRARNRRVEIVISGGMLVAGNR